MTIPPDAASEPGWPWLGAYEPHPDLSGARPVLAGSGMVSTPHHLATTIGLDILRAGGNAVDAAVAASAALMVTVPMQCSPGGDAIWLIRAPDGTIEALDASGRSSARASADALRGRSLTSIPMRSADAVTVPGAVSGWVEALRRHGTRSLAELLEPAASLAERGFVIGRHGYASFRAAMPALRQWDSLSLWSRDDAPPAMYSRLQQPRLAEALRLIGRTEGRALYEGALAREIAEAVGRSGGVLSVEDLATHRSEWVEPLEADFRGLTLYTTPPSTQGVALLEAARLIERLSPGPLDLASADAVHLMVEAVASALEDRDRVVTDRSRLPMPPGDLYAAPHIDAIAADFDPLRAGQRQRSLGSTRGLGGTAHLAVVDAERRAVSLIQSLFFDFGSGIPVRGGGFTLQNRGAAFSLEEGSVNELGPSLRPRTTLAPAMACRGNDLALVMGCMGGDGQVQSLVQLLVAMLDAGLDPQQAVARPRWYFDRALAAAPRVLVESGVEAAIIEGLRRKGHEVAVLGASEEIMGHAQVIAVEKTGALAGATDRRSDGQAAGW
jgi:gamma-glutamyltranspeptidase